MRLARGTNPCNGAGIRRRQPGDPAPGHEGDEGAGDADQPPEVVEQGPYRDAERSCGSGYGRDGIGDSLQRRRGGHGQLFRETPLDQAETRDGVIGPFDLARVLVCCRCDPHPQREGCEPGVSRFHIPTQRCEATPVRIATEGALWGAIRHHGFLTHAVVVSDGAGQFRIGDHALCWVHAERLVHKLMPMTPDQRQSVDS